MGFLEACDQLYVWRPKQGRSSRAWSTHSEAQRCPRPSLCAVRDPEQRSTGRGARCNTPNLDRFRWPPTLRLAQAPLGARQQLGRRPVAGAQRAAMGGHTVAEILKDLEDVVGEQLQVRALGLAWLAGVASVLLARGEPGGDAWPQGLRRGGAPPPPHPPPRRRW